jgi:anti-sigma factor RsiW
MRCRKAEKSLLQSFDRALEAQEKNELEEHLRSCTRCQKKEKEYRMILGVLREEEALDLLPHFWERLRAKIQERRKASFLPLWQKWSLRVIPGTLVLILVLAAAMIFVLPRRQEELSQSEILLLQNENPLLETKNLLEERKLEDKNMMLIFTAMEEKESSRRYFP